jgi:hypothetical protein
MVLFVFIYTFHASEPDSRPPPVSFFLLQRHHRFQHRMFRCYIAIPQSEPVTDKNNSASRKLLVMIAEDNPCATPFWLRWHLLPFLNISTNTKQVQSFMLYNFECVICLSNCRFNVTTTFVTFTWKNTAFNKDFSSLGNYFFLKLCCTFQLHACQLLDPHGCFHPMDSMRNCLYAETIASYFIVNTFVNDYTT